MLAEFMAFLTASYCLILSALKSMFSHYLSFEIRETMNTILYFIALIPLKSLLLPKRQPYNSLKVPLKSMHMICCS